MNQLKPLLYLTYKTTFNGLKRAVTTPRRLAYFVFFCLYYFYLINRVAFGGVSPNGQLPDRFVGLFQFPPLQVVDSFAFCLFGLGWLVMLISVPNYQNNARPADVDILFPTPIPPAVVLGFKIARDYFFTLITPLFVLILGMRATRIGWEAIFRGYPHPELSGLVMRSLALGWILMAFCYVGIVHAVGLYTFRSDRRSDRNRLILHLVVGAFLLAFVGFTISHFLEDPAMKGLVDFAQSPMMRAVFFLPTCATEIALAPFRGSFFNAALGAAGLLLTVFLSLRVAFSQASWYYDQAAVKGNSAQTMRQLQRKGDYSAVAAERARAGKLRIRESAWLMRLKMCGSWAIIWKELILEPRSLRGLMAFLLVLQIGMAIPTALAPTTGKSPDTGAYLLAFCQGFWVLMTTSIMGHGGFLDLLKRVDLTKALPIKPYAIVRNEILGRSLFGIVATWLGCVSFCAVSVEQWQVAVAASIFWSFAMVLFTACGFFVTILFPDSEDQTQRQFRGLMNLLALMVTGFVPVGIFATGLALKLFPVISSLVAGLSALGIAAILFLISGNLYASYNPSE